MSEYQAPEGTANLDRMRLAAEAFKTLSAEEKARLEELNIKDKARRDEQMKMLNSKGYFLLADGTKSSDAKTKKRRAARPVSESEPEPEVKRAKTGKR